MKPCAFDYAAPATLEEALALLAQHGDDARPLAGGQSLVPMLALRLARPSVVIDLNRIRSLVAIRREGGALCIGAMTRQARLLESAEVLRHAPLLAQALAHVGHPPTRARGTIGGSLAHADPAAELPVAMVALGARMTIAGSGGTRTVEAAEFVRGMFETALRPGELLTEIRIPAASGGSAFDEVAPRKGDFAIVSAAAIVTTGGDGSCASARLVLGGIGPTPVRCTAAEELLVGRKLTDDVLAAAAARLPAERIEMDSRSASRAYRLRVAPVIARRALAAATRAVGTPS